MITSTKPDMGGAIPIFRDQSEPILGFYFSITTSPRDTTNTRFYGKILQMHNLVQWRRMQRRRPLWRWLLHVESPSAEEEDDVRTSRCTIAIWWNPLFCMASPLCFYRINEKCDANGENHMDEFVGVLLGSHPVLQLQIINK